MLDRDVVSGDDRRLLAHLAPDEPRENAALVARCYLAQADDERRRCRALVAEDLSYVPFGEQRESPELPVRSADAEAPLEDRDGRRYSICPFDSGMSIPELRWCRAEPTTGARAPISVRDAIAAVDSYGPVRARTSEAIRRHGGDDEVSVALLRAELARVERSPIVLNRALREAVLVAIDRDALSMSEIAIRCGRVKRDRAGNASGETSWLARRVGLLAEAGRDEPTRWIHSDVLALIARDGLGVSPREVETC